MATGTPTVVDRLLGAFRAGEGVAAALLAPDAILDATIPGWRRAVENADGVARPRSGWFEQPGAPEELGRLPIDGGELVTYSQGHCGAERSARRLRG